MYTYKVECFYDYRPFYTDIKKEAESVFEQLKDDYRDGVRLYEEIKPDNDDDEIEWEVIDYFDQDEEIPLENIK
ncbi:MAG: hypothetical protein KBG19_04290 [Bacteroidales bacterium]|nr:hypothetical protein [Bacteroidales bacterium]